MAQGGSQEIARALGGQLCRLGGEIEVGREVVSAKEFPEGQTVLFDVTPRQLLKIAGSRLTEDYQQRLSGYRYGWGVFKIDYALDGPIPWRAKECTKAGTVHVGGTLEEICSIRSGRRPGRAPREAVPSARAAKPL